MKRANPPIVTSSKKLAPSKRARRKSGSTGDPRDGADGPILEVTTLHNIDTDRFELEFRFKALDGERTCRVSRGLKNNLNQIVAELNCSGANFPKAAGNPKDVVATALDFETKVRPITRQSGWHNNAYVLPGTTIATKGDPDGALTFDAAPHQATGIDRNRGKFSIWKRGLKGPCRSSRHLTFAVALAFSGPLAKLLKSELSEGVIFLLAGQSGTGKTLACRAAQSVFGRSDTAELATFDLTARASEELFALYNDGTFVIDEVGRAGARAVERRQKLADLAYTAPGGRGRIRSKRVQTDGLANQTWTVNCLGSTEERIDGDNGGPERRKGEQVRLIELAVPLQCDGGIFDRAPTERSEMAAQVGKIVDENYGLALRRFLQVLVDDEHAAPTVLAAFRRFLKLTEKERPGRDRRLASKFALVFAAGKLAHDYRLAPWTRRGLHDSVLTLWREASASVDGQSAKLLEAAKKVQELARDRSRVVKLREGAPFPTDAIGLTRSRGDREEIVLHPVRLADALKMSEADTNVVMTHFHRAGVLLPDGDNQKQQVRLVGLPQTRPRCFVLDQQKLHAMKFDF